MLDVLGSRQSYTSAAHVSLAVCQGQRDQDGSSPNAPSTSLCHSLWHPSLCISFFFFSQGPSLVITGEMALTPSVSHPRLARPFSVTSNEALLVSITW